MDFVGAMLFTQQVFHLECFVFHLTPFNTYDCVTCVSSLNQFSASCCGELQWGYKVK